MRQKSFDTGRGNIVYGVSDEPDVARPWLVFLPGLTADHRLFEGQIEHFESRANCLVWDAPAHGLSRPFPLDFSLEDMARWLGDVLDAEGATDPLLVGQSLGGYVAQVFDVLFPGRARGIVSVDSAPLGRSYYKSWELACLPFVTRMFRLYPWETLQKASSEGNAATEAGRAIMVAMMADYSKDEYCLLSTHGFAMLADVVRSDDYAAPAAPLTLIVGERDNTGFIRKYNELWSQRTGQPIHWIEGAAHNANTDNPQAVNAIIEKVLAVGA